MSWLNICSNAMMGKSLGFLMGLRCKRKLGTPLTNLRDQKTYKGNLGYGHKYTFLAYTVGCKLVSLFGMVSLLKSRVLQG